MAMLTVRKTKPEQVRERLRESLRGPGLAPGDRLASMSTLAARFGVSVPTVKAALDALEAEGLVVKRQGSGTFVAPHSAPLALADSVVLCMESQQDVWGDLAGCLLRGLHSHGRFVSLIDTAHSSSSALIQRILQSDAACLVIHGGRHFPFAALRTAEFRPKPTISVVDWEPSEPAPPAHLVLADYGDGARQVARHLGELGHRRLLVVGSVTQMACFAGRERDWPWALPTSMRREWEAVGGQWTALASVEEVGRVTFPSASLLAAFDGAEAPTAIVALRDSDALAAQRVVNLYRPELAARLAILGFYDTAWTLAGEPPITGMAIDIERLAAETVALVDRVIAEPGGQPERCLVPLRLNVRGTSVAAHSGRDN